MAKYIDTEILMQKISKMIDYCQKDKKVSGLTALFQVGDAIIDCPTADVQEVKHGQWEIDNATFELCGVKFYKCSECGASEDVRTTFCHNCGAEMDLEGDE